MVRSLTKLQGHQITQIIDDEYTWSDDETWWLDEYRENYWDGVLSGEMSWQWYMEVSLRRREGWTYVIINKNYKNIAVENWIKENSPNCKYKYESQHFLIEQQEVAMMVTLQWT